MDAVGGAASILAIAGAGIQISLKLIAFADQVSTASKRIQEVGTDVSVTAGTLREIGELMDQKTHTRKSAGMFYPDQVESILSISTRCEEIFDELKGILSRASKQLRGVYDSTTKSQDTSAKVNLSKIERMKWPFLQPPMESLRSALRDAKGTLMLVLQVVHLRHAQRTGSMDSEGQTDLIRMIATICRQQQALAYGGGGSNKGLEAGDVEDSDSGEFSEVRTVLKAWSVTPNTSSTEAFRHLLITPIPVSQQQIIKLLKTSPQDIREIASIVENLSVPEREAILGGVLGNSRSHLGDLTIRSISHQSWTGSHDLFGRVTGRKFKLVTEREVRKSRSENANMKHQAPQAHRARHAIPSQRHHHHGPDSSIYNDFDNSDGTHDIEFGRRRPRIQRKTCPVPEPRMPRRSSFSGYFSDEDREKPDSKHHSDWAKEEEIKRQQERKSEWDSCHSHPRSAREPSDDDLVRSLLAQYTDFEIEEPLVQSTATPPPAYDEDFAIPERVRRRY